MMLKMGLLVSSNLLTSFILTNKPYFNIIARGNVKLKTVILNYTGLKMFLLAVT